MSAITRSRLRRRIPAPRPPVCCHCPLQGKCPEIVGNRPDPAHIDYAYNVGYFSNQSGSAEPAKLASAGPSSRSWPTSRRTMEARSSKAIAPPMPNEVRTSCSPTCTSSGSPPGGSAPSTETCSSTIATDQRARAFGQHDALAADPGGLPRREPLNEPARTWSVLVGQRLAPPRPNSRGGKPYCFENISPGAFPTSRGWPLADGCHGALAPRRKRFFGDSARLATTWPVIEIVNVHRLVRSSIGRMSRSSRRHSVRGATVKNGRPCREAREKALRGLGPM